jgi:hypothetical protein
METENVQKYFLNNLGEKVKEKKIFMAALKIAREKNVSRGGDSLSSIG